MGLFDVTRPVDPIEDQRVDARRTRALALALAGMQNLPQGQMVSGIYVPPSPLAAVNQGLGSLVQAFAAYKDTELEDAERKQRSAALSSLVQDGDIDPAALMQVPGMEDAAVRLAIAKQQQEQKSPYGFMNAGSDIVRTDSRTGTVERMYQGAQREAPQWQEQRDSAGNLLWTAPGEKPVYAPQQASRPRTPEEEARLAGMREEAVLRARQQYAPKEQSYKPTEAQNRLGVLLPTMEAAHQFMVDQFASGESGYNPAGVRGMWDKFANSHDITRWLASDAGQQYLAHAREFVANAGYGKSGQNLTETEWENGRQAYIPQPGDTQEKIQQKLERQAQALGGFRNAIRGTPLQGIQQESIQPGAAQQQSGPPNGWRKIGDGVWISPEGKTFVLKRQP